MGDMTKAEMKWCLYEYHPDHLTEDLRNELMPLVTNAKTDPYEEMKKAAAGFPIQVPGLL